MTTIENRCGLVVLELLFDNLTEPGNSSNGCWLCHRVLNPRPRQYDFRRSTRLTSGIVAG
jgi:hypothetical protein